MKHNHNVIGYLDVRQAKQDREERNNKKYATGNQMAFALVDAAIITPQHSLSALIIKTARSIR